MMRHKCQTEMPFIYACIVVSQHGVEGVLFCSITQYGLPAAEDSEAAAVRCA